MKFNGLQKELVKKAIAISLGLGVTFSSGYMIATAQANNKLDKAQAKYNEAMHGMATMGNKVQELQKKELVTLKGEVTDTDPYFHKEDGARLFELSDGSWFIIDEARGEYVFQPIDLGDWDYQVDSMEKLRMIVETYVSMKNTGTW